MSRPTRAALLEDVIHKIEEAIAARGGEPCPSCGGYFDEATDDLADLRKDLRQHWLDEIAIETRAACDDKEVA